MKILTNNELAQILNSHQHWLDLDVSAWDGTAVRADLSNVDLRNTKLHCRNLTRIDFRGADLSGAILDAADLSFCDLRDTIMVGTSLKNANLRNADLRYANVKDARFTGTNLSGTNLSQVINLPSTIDFLKENFNYTQDGIIAYKTFNSFFAAPKAWYIAEGSVISENCDFDRTRLCSFGINVAPLSWIKRHIFVGSVWKVLIRWEWLPGIVVPYNTDGPIRCERCELLKIIEDTRM